MTSTDGNASTPGSGSGSASGPTSTPAASGVLAATCVSALVVNANTSAVSILLPAISQDTGASLATLQWAVTGYSLVGAAVIVTSGALGDIFGRRRIFVYGLLLFVASCVLIALARGGALVIAGRAVQGAAGSTILACGLSLLSAGTAGDAQMRAVSLWGAASAVGAAGGPLLGGVLVDAAGWQGLFWVDAGVAAACVPLALRTIPESRDPTRPKSVDLAGTALVAAVLVPFVFAVTEGDNWGWLSAPTLACFVISGAAVVGFAIVEQRVRTPLIDLAVLRNKIFQSPATPGMTPLEAGLATLPAAAGIVITAPADHPVRVHRARVRPRVLAVLGLRAPVGAGLRAGAGGRGEHRGRAGDRVRPVGHRAGGLLRVRRRAGAARRADPAHRDAQQRALRRGGRRDGAHAADQTDRTGRA